MQRRRFLQYGLLAATATLVPAVRTQVLAREAGRGFHLTIDAVNAEMVDGTAVYMLMYFLNDESPRPVLRVTEGEIVSISIANGDTRPHGFAISGVPAATIPAIPPGQTATTSFIAPVGGSYLYFDPFNDPVNRLLGLHGALIVAPRLGTTPAGSPTPFSSAAQTPQVQAVFDAMGGGHPRFPGEKWDPTDPRREKVWIFSQTDPSLNDRAARGELIDGTRIIGSFLPRYFAINGLSGFDTAVHDGTMDEMRDGAEAIMPTGKQGQPCLIRTMNAGLATHSPHIHGNHIFDLTEAMADGTVRCETHVLECDAWTLKPLARKDVLLPFERPPDIPVWPPRQEPFPLRYVMHCHTEMSQTAGGGNYPQGIVTHWEMTHPI